MDHALALPEILENIFQHLHDDPSLGYGKGGRVALLEPSRVSRRWYYCIEKLIWVRVRGSELARLSKEKRERCAGYVKYLTIQPQGEEKHNRLFRDLNFSALKDIKINHDPNKANLPCRDIFQYMQPNLESFRCTNLFLDDFLLNRLHESCPRLKELELTQLSQDNSSISFSKFIGKCESLEEIYMDRSASLLLGSSALIHLAGLRTFKTLRCTQLPEPALEEILSKNTNPFPNLQELRTIITEEGLGPLTAVVGHVDKIDLYFRPGGASMSHLAALRGTRNLELRFPAGVTFTGSQLRPLRRLTNLEVLSMRGVPTGIGTVMNPQDRFGDEVFCEIVSGLRNIRQLTFDISCTLSCETSLMHLLRSCPNLTRLEMVAVRFDIRYLQDQDGKIPVYPNLKRLCLLALDTDADGLNDDDL